MRRNMLPLLLVLVLLTTGFTFQGWRKELARGDDALDQGKAQEAVDAYHQALVDAPEEPVVHYNLANALYQQKDYTTAEKHYQQAITQTEDPHLTAQAQFNLGNVAYRMGQSLAKETPQEAINHYEMALQHYKSAMQADSTDEDAKYNYEFVQRKLEELKKEMEKNKQEQKDKSSEENQDQQNQDQEQNQSGKNQDQQNQSENQNSQNGAKDQQDQSDQKEEEKEKKQSSEENQQDKTENQGAANSSENEKEEGQEQLIGMTMQEALQLLEQFTDQQGELIPVKPGELENPGDFKDW